MRRISFFMLLGSLLALGSIAARAGVYVLDEQNGRLTLEARFDSSATAGADNRTSVGLPAIIDVPGFPSLRYERVYVALPPEGTFRAATLGAHFADNRGDLPRIVENVDEVALPTGPRLGSGFFPTNPIVVSSPFTFRKTRVIAIDCYMLQVDYAAGVERRWSGYRVEVLYPRVESFVEASEADPLVTGLVVNPSFLSPIGGRRLSERPGGTPGRSMAVPDPHFSLSTHWVRITVDSTGIYSIDGSDLLRIGVDPAGIEDPRSFRLFTRGGRQLDRRDTHDVPFTDPDGTWRPGQWMTECDILVEGAEDGVFDPNDRIIFYGVGAQGWVDMAEPGAPRYEYENHLFAKENAYYLTWDDVPGFPGEPRRMTEVPAAPIASGADVTQFEDRLYMERNLVEAYTFGGDGWQWVDVVPEGSGLITFPSFNVYDLVPARPQTFRTLPLAAVKQDQDNSNHHAVYLINGSQIGDVVFNSTKTYEMAVPYETTGVFLQEGSNTLRLRVPRDLNPRDFMYFDHYEIFYTRQLRARGNTLLFDSGDTTGAVDFRVADFSAGAHVYVFDISDPFRPRSLTGCEETDAGGRRQVRFSYSMAQKLSYFYAAEGSAFKSPSRIARHSPRDLRNVTTSPHMLIICHPAFKAAADRLKAHRESHYPYPYAPDIEVVTTQEVFDNFSGGIIDPMAIRNYCKFLYDNFKAQTGYPLLSFVLLLGDANVDSKNYITTQENLVPTNFNLHPYTLDAYATDDWFAEMEPPDSSRASFIQFATGRLPAGSATDALFLVDKTIDYETRAEYGPWRDRVVLVADDENTPGRGQETYFVTQSESIAEGYLAGYLEPVKIYLTEYPFIGSSKPASRFDFINRWNEGALAINYIGHGNSQGMADEQVFLGDDVANLRNGLRLPVFTAFSCTIGDFGRAQRVSLGEKLLLWESGGVIASITASETSLIHYNFAVNYRLYQQMSPVKPGPSKPLGVALMLAKTGALMSVADSDTQVVFTIQQNSEKYNLLGDPSLSLGSPRNEIMFSRADVDTFTAGKRATIRGTVQKNGSLDATFNGKVDLLVREPDDQSGYTSPPPIVYIPYRYPGGTVYRGTADVKDGAFQFSVKFPRSVGTGPLAFVRAYADDGSGDAAAVFDSCYVTEPLPGDTTGLKPLDGAPRVDMGFPGGQTIVKPGTELRAKIRDADGIDVLNTTPEGKMALVFDQTNLPLDVTSSFQFDHGGTDTSGVLLFPLPDLGVGGHQLILKVADSFGLVRLDTLRFAMADPQEYIAQFVLNYPNPFATTTHFLIELTDPADIRLDIFTVSGKKIRTLHEASPAGQAWVFWDGRDSVGETIANGTYLYVARVSFLGLERPPVVLRGKVVKIE
jgi:hypothetical protein